MHAGKIEYFIRTAAVVMVKTVSTFLRVTDQADYYADSISSFRFWSGRKNN